VTVSESDLEFLENNHSAAMITVVEDGVAKVAKVGVGLVDGKLWSSGTADRVRTRRLRADPRCTLFVHDAAYGWVALETTVTILDGPDVPELSVRLFRKMQGRLTGPLSWFGGDLIEEEFRQAMVDERRLIYEFGIHHTYGLH
jgi:PPOX class probable F420-dependent enzyme